MACSSKVGRSVALGVGGRTWFVVLQFARCVPPSQVTRYDYRPNADVHDAGPVACRSSGRSPPLLTLPPARHYGLSDTLQRLLAPRAEYMGRTITTNRSRKTTSITRRQAGPPEMSQQPWSSPWERAKAGDHVQIGRRVPGANYHYKQYMKNNLYHSPSSRLWDVATAVE